MEEENKKLLLDKKRIERYNEKLEHLTQNFENLEKWTKDVNADYFERELDLIKQYGIYHAFQIAVEVTTDIIAMIVKDIKKVPKDDYTNIRIVMKNEIITKPLSSQLREANGLRNRIVHNYNDIESFIAFDSLKGLISSLRSFKEEILEWLKNR